jgi:hypothetical protein
MCVTCSRTTSKFPERKTMPDTRVSRLSTNKVGMFVRFLFPSLLPLILQLLHLHLVSRTKTAREKSETERERERERLATQYSQPGRVQYLILLHSLIGTKVTIAMGIGKSPQVWILTPTLQILGL